MVRHYSYFCFCCIWFLSVKSAEALRVKETVKIEILHVRVRLTGRVMRNSFLCGFL